MRWLAVMVLCALAGCVPRLGDGEPARTEAVTVGETTLRLQYLPQDAGAARDVAEALQAALPRAERWGRLRAPVTLVIHPTHEALEVAVNRPGYEWLRAWARFASVDLQSPRCWSLFGPDRQQLEELLAHELTHCVMYQAAATEWSWAYKAIPLWFREGMASVTAGQGYRRSGPEPVWRFYAAAASPGAGDGAGGSGGGSGRGGASRAPAGADPLTDPDPLYRADSDLVYGTAHLAFQFLLDRYGEERIRRLLGEMSEGRNFPAAFRLAMGLPLEDFEADFRRYIAWRGWKG